MAVLTPIPYQGIRVGPPTELTTIQTQSIYPSVGLFSMALSGDTLVGAANEAGQIKLYAIDLNNGNIRQIGTSNPGIAKMRVSGRYVVWNRASVEEIFAYDLLKNEESRIASGAAPDLSGNTVVWVDLRDYTQGNSADIYGYDLSLGKEFPIVTGPGTQTQPKISGAWVAYLEMVGERDYRLRVHQLTTGEDFEIGAVPVFIPPSPAVAARYFALSGNRLVWVPAQSPQTVHLYDLTARIDRTLLESAVSFHDILLDGDTLLCDGGRIGYDLSRNASFSIPRRPDEWSGASSSPTLLSGNRLVWTLTKDKDQIQHLFTAQIIRDK